MKYLIPNPLSHAYIITGGREESRLEYAKELAAAYQCDSSNPPCGCCRPCTKVAKNVHPDVIFVFPMEGKKDILADQARQLRSDVYIRPNEGKRKVYLIQPADSMNSSAQNSLLKVLEDGPYYAAFLFLAEKPGQLLETIRSRCEILALPPERQEKDPEIEEIGKAVAEQLLNGDEWDLACTLTALEVEKRKASEILNILDAAEAVVSDQLVQNRRAVPVLQALKHCRDISVYNMSVGSTLGWLCTNMGTKLEGL